MAASQDSKSGEAASFSLTREALEQYLSEMEERVIDEKQGAFLHSVVAINQVFRHPDLPGLLNDELKSQMKDLWLKLKAGGMKLNDPPLLFGLPADFAEKDEVDVEDEHVSEYSDELEQGVNGKAETDESQQQEQVQ